MSWIPYITQKLESLTTSFTIFGLVIFFCTVWAIWEMAKWEEKLNLDSYLDKNIYFAVGFAPIFWTILLVLIYILFQYLFNQLLQQGASHLLNNMIAALFAFSLLLNYFFSKKSTKALVAIENVVRWLNKVTEFRPTYEALQKRGDKVIKFLGEKCWFLDLLSKKITVEDESGNNSVVQTQRYRHRLFVILLDAVSLLLSILFGLIFIPIIILNFVLIFPLMFLYVNLMIEIPTMFLFTVQVPLHVLSQRILKESLYKSVVRITTLLALFAILLNWLFNYLALSSK